MVEGQKQKAAFYAGQHAGASPESFDWSILDLTSIYGKLERPCMKELDTVRSKDQTAVKTLGVEDSQATH